jgi:hypothetical protein
MGLVRHMMGIAIVVMAVLGIFAGGWLAGRLSIGSVVDPASLSEAERQFEGPTVDRDGNVYFTDIINQRIMKLGADGVLSTYRERSNVANGSADRSAGAADRVRRGGVRAARREIAGHAAVTRTDLKTGKIEMLADGYEGKPFVGPNDVTIDGRGRLYFTDWPAPPSTASTRPARSRASLPRRRPAAQRHSGLAGRQDAVSDRSQSGARRRADDPRLRPAADGTVRNMRVHYNFYPGPQRRRDEHRYSGEPVRLGRHEPAARQLGDARHEDRRLRDLAGGQAAEVHSDSRKTSSRTMRSAART